eukprot:Phypoly_transcript_11654.p1 GENE.Phypoly_transcript_11654~~Phypoly_transcript_11654.p1  ORF type:complete len:337 (+),score=40.66 Phypoly_transcript_11654:93-1103(+)
MYVPCFYFLLLLCATSQAVFDCPSLPPHVPANVNDLHPNDIKVVMALGDSITAFGIMGTQGRMNEFRGLSWSIGGDQNATTFANFLRYYSPDIQGFSLGEHGAEICYGILCPPFQYHPLLDVLDAAQSGAMVSDLVTHEMDYLITTLKGNSAINFEEDWKVLSILIGANDLCASCTFLDKKFLDPDEFEAHLSSVLENVRKNIPRVFVNLVEMFNISQVYDLSLKTKRCAEIHRDLFIECDCIFGPQANKTRSVVDMYVQEYNARSRGLAAYYQAFGDPNFTVVAQPFASNTALRDQPTDILSTLDCFHPSLIAHEALATALWNNMLTPAASKKRS